MKLLNAVILATTLCLAGCFETMPKTQYVPLPEECKQEIPTQSIDMYAPPYDDIYVATQHLLGDREKDKAYIDKIVTRLKSCK